jgi:hypothetical protein
MRMLPAILSAGLLAGLLTGCFSYSSREDEWRGPPSYYGYSNGYYHAYPSDEGYYYNRGGSCWNCGRY